MAGSGVLIGGGSHSNYKGKVTWFVILSSMMAAMGALLFGYDIGVSGGVTSMEPFLRKFFPKVYMKMKNDTKVSNYCKFNSELLTSFTSSLYIAGLVATFLASYVTKVYGRKPSILLGGVAFFVGFAVGGAALNVYMLILGRLLLGIGVGFCNQAVPLYLSEMAPPKYRGGFNNGFQLGICVGGVIATLVNYGSEKVKGGWGWRISLGVGVVPSLILILGAIALPETPNSLIQTSNKNDRDHNKANLVLQKIRGTKEVEQELDDLINANTTSLSKSDNNPFMKILQYEYRPQLVMAIAIPCFQQMTGINVIGFYAPILFRTLGFGESASLLSSVMTAIVATTSTIISMLLVDKFGRRALFIFGGVQMFVSNIAIGVILALQLEDHGAISKGYAYIVLVLICVYVAGFSWSWGPLGWLVPSEIFQLEIRSIGQSVTVGVSFLFTFAIAQTFLAMLCYFKAMIFIFFGGWVLVMTVFVYLYLPETRGIAIEKMDKVWREHWFWTRFV